MRIQKDISDIDSEKRKTKQEEYENDFFAKREAEVGIRLTHKNVVRYYGRGVLKDGTRRNYTIEEHVDGVSLDQLMLQNQSAKNNNIIQNDKIIIARETVLGLIPSLINHVLEGVAYIHSQGFVHRDLKLGNILVPYSFIANPDSQRAEDAVKVGDLGLVKSIEECRKDRSNVGPRRYTAPEVFATGRYSPAADVFSLGIILYELYAGEHPFLFCIPIISSSSDEERHKKIIHANIVYKWTYPLVQQNIKKSTMIPDEWKPVIERCLQYKPQDRYQNAGEMVAIVKREG